MCICWTRPSLNMFCPWSCEEERGSYLFCKDILDVPFQLLSSKYKSNCRRPLTMQIAKKQARTTSKYAIAKYTQVFLYFRSVKYHRFTANEDYLFFFFKLYRYLFILCNINGHCCTSVAFFIL